MIELQVAKQQVVSIETELAKRTVEAENAQRQASQLQQNISRWNGSMALDGTDFTEQINGARTELGKAETLIRLFPDVKAELQRRLESARAEFKQAQIGVKSDELQQMVEDEEKLRSEFFATATAFLKVADKLNETIVRKEATRLQISQMGGGSAFGIERTTIPAFYQAWVRSGRGVQAAMDEWRHQKESITIA